MRAIVTGMIATYGLGGVAWDYGQYALALERLGFEVFYLEYTGGYVYDTSAGLYGENWDAGAKFLQEALAWLSPGLADRWHFRTMDDQIYGLSAKHIEKVVSEADVFVNVSGAALLHPDYMGCPRKILIDTDPGWNHFVTYREWDEVWGEGLGLFGTLGYKQHDHFFTYAERIHEPDCLLPDYGLAWMTTRPPVVLDRWQPEPPGKTWTTVMTWDNFRRPLEYEGKVYGTKELEFPKIESLPSHVDAPLEVAAGGDTAPREHWADLGWNVVDSHSVSETAGDYRSYIQGSRGEFSVAKNVYVGTRCGWFSCRSVCYLASGRPVVIQDTGFSDVIPTGSGLVAYEDLDGAAAGIRSVESSYAEHQDAARELARTHFDSELVVGRMLTEVGL